jgi:hypothetical protein
VTAGNSGGNGTTTITLTVNDITPSITYSPASIICTRNSNCTFAAPTNTGGPATSFALVGTLPAGMTFNTTTGAIGGTPSVIRTTATTYTVNATNSGGTGSTTITLTVNDVVPVLTYSPASQTCIVGSLCSVAAPGNTGGPATSWAITGTLPAGLTFNTGTGAISGTPTSPQAATGYPVTATNSGGTSTAATLTLTVNDTAPNIAYAPPALTCTKGSPCSLGPPTSSGGAVVSYAITGTLPAGLTFNTATGVISGTPSVVLATTSFTVTATNSGGTNVKTVTVTVNDVAPAVSYAPAASYAPGAAVTLNPTSTGGAVTSYTATGLPAGLGSINATTGVISGTTPATTGTYSFTVTATNSGGSVNVGVTVVVACGGGAPNDCNGTCVASCGTCAGKTILSGTTCVAACPANTFQCDGACVSDCSSCTSGRTFGCGVTGTCIVKSACSDGTCGAATVACSANNRCVTNCAACTPTDKICLAGTPAATGAGECVDSCATGCGGTSANGGNPNTCQ